MIRVGRLLEARPEGGYRTVAEVDDFFSAVVEEITKLPAAELVVMIIDLRHCPLLSSEAAERALAQMSGNNARIERSAVLGSPDSPVAMLQFLRLVRASNNPNRRLFKFPDQLCRWLAEVLTARETERMYEFLEAPFHPSNPTRGW
jgi:hypothetical protein